MFRQSELNGGETCLQATLLHALREAPEAIHMLGSRCGKVWALRLGHLCPCSGMDEMMSLLGQSGFLLGVVDDTILTTILTTGPRKALFDSWMEKLIGLVVGICTETVSCLG